MGVDTIDERDYPILKDYPLSWTRVQFKGQLQQLKTYDDDRRWDNDDGYFGLHQ